MVDTPESPDFSADVDPLVPEAPRVTDWAMFPRFLKEAAQFFHSLTGAVLQGNQLEKDAHSHLLQVAIGMGASEETAALAADHAIWWHRTGVSLPGGALPPAEAPPPALMAPPATDAEGSDAPTAAPAASSTTFSAPDTVTSPTAAPRPALDGLGDHGLLGGWRS